MAGKELSPFKEKKINPFIQVPNGIETVKRFGDWIKDSKMFGVKTDGQALMLAYSALANGTDLIELRRQFHIANGEFTMKSREMHNRFLRSGGVVQQIERSSTRAALTVRRAGLEATFEFTLQEAIREDYVFTADANRGAVPKVLEDGQINDNACKDNWKTPRRRMQMLWARCITDAIGAFAADVTGGFYSPEEVVDGYVPEPEDGDVVEADFVVVSDNAGSPAVRAGSTPANSSSAGSGGEVDAKATTAVEPAPPVVKHKTVQPEEPASADSHQRLKSLKESLGYSSETWKELIRQFGVESAKCLCEGDAQQLLSLLMQRQQIQEVVKDQAGFMSESTGQTP